MLEPVEAGPPVIADAPPDDAGIESFCPTFNLAGSTPKFAASSALSVRPCRFAIFPSVSPWTTTYSVPATAYTGGGTTTGATTGGLETSVGGGFVFMTTML